MYKTQAEARAYFSALAPLVKDARDWMSIFPKPESVQATKTVPLLVRVIVGKALAREAEKDPEGEASALSTTCALRAKLAPPSSDLEIMSVFALVIPRFGMRR